MSGEDVFGESPMRALHEECDMIRKPATMSSVVDGYVVSLEMNVDGYAPDEVARALHLVAVCLESVQISAMTADAPRMSMGPKYQVRRQHFKCEYTSGSVVHTT